MHQRVYNEEKFSAAGWLQVPAPVNAALAYTAQTINILLRVLYGLAILLQKGCLTRFYLIIHSLKYWILFSHEFNMFPMVLSSIAANVLLKTIQNTAAGKACNLTYF